MRHVIYIAVAIIVLLMHPTAMATTYYVRQSGTDANPGTTAQNAWRTIDKAADNVNAGDIVYVGAGTYSESVRILRSGASGQPIRFVADKLGAQTGDAGAVVVTHPSSDVIYVNADYIEIDGFEITGGHHGIYYQSSDHGMVQNCHVHDVGNDGIRLAHATVQMIACTVERAADDAVDCHDTCNIIFLNSIARDCAEDGVEFDVDGSYATVVNSVVTGNAADGIEIEEGVDINVTNCFVHNNGDRGIAVFNTFHGTATIWNTTVTNSANDGFQQSNGTVNLTNTIIASSGDDGIDLNAGTLNHTYNLLWGNGDNQFEGTSAGTGELVANPKFLTADGYQLTAPSPALDAGTDASAVTSIDLDGNSRPVGAGWDIGCYEGTFPLTFADVSVPVGFNYQTTADENTGSALHWGDLDNDGDLDVIVTGESSARKLMNNNGGATFSVTTFGGGNVRRQGALIDLDNDGDLDFWNVSVGSWDTEQYFENDGTGAFTNKGDLGFGDGSNNEGLAAADVNLDGWIDLVMFSGNDNWLALHPGTKPVSLSGSNDSDIGLSGPGDTGNGVYASSGDVNNDGYVDFFYHHSGGKLFLSNGDSTYTESDSGINIQTASGSSTQKAASAWADYDNDGDLDLFAARYQSGPNVYLWRNDGGAFTDVAGSAGIIVRVGSRSGCWGDYDNDGDLDLYVVTRAGNDNELYQNDGDGTFTRVYVGATAGGDGHDCVFVDYDNDGDLDIAATRQSAPNMLFRNSTDDNNYLKVRVVGGGSGRTNGAGVGVRVELYAADGTTFLARREIGVARGYGGAEPNWVHFGGVNPAQTYVVKVHLAPDPVTQEVVPAATSSTIGSTVVAQMLTVQEMSQLVLKNYQTPGADRRADALRAKRDAPGFTPPVKDIDHLKTLDQN